jgi:hypothetical protein
MKKENLIAQLEGAKALSSQVDIDKVIELIQGLEAEVKVEKVFGITQELAEQLEDKIQRTLEYNSDQCVDKDSACFEIGYNNQVELTDVNLDIYEVMKHVEGVLQEFVIEEDKEETDPEEDDAADQPAPEWDGSMGSTVDEEE